MFGSIGMPELLVVLAISCVPLLLLYFVYRRGYNSGYRKGMERSPDHSQGR
jgi:hypothetical protein